MTDIVDGATRSRMMSAIHGKNTKPEMQVRRFLHSRGLRYRLHDKRLPGRPDLAFPRYRTAVFVQGCFWHQHKGCAYAYTPKSRVPFWSAKFEDTEARDLRNRKELAQSGWRVIWVWECYLRSTSRAAVLERLYRKILRPRTP